MNTFMKCRAKQLVARQWLPVLVAFAYLLAPGSAAAQAPQKAQPAPAQAPDALHQLNASIEALVQRVSPAVVQIQVTGYSTAQESGQGQTSLVIGKQKAIGSGVIVDPSGYIVTNAHVVNGAEKIEVIVPPQLAINPSPDANREMRER